MSFVHRSPLERRIGELREEEIVAAMTRGNLPLGFLERFQAALNEIKQAHGILPGMVFPRDAMIDLLEVTCDCFIESMDEVARSGEDACYICMEKKPRCTFLPCGHSGTCVNCTTKALGSSQICPLCRAFVADFKFTGL